RPAPTPTDDQHEDTTARRARPKCRAWADLMGRAFEADVLACPTCGGRMTVLATIETRGDGADSHAPRAVPGGRGGLAAGAGVALDRQPSRIERPSRWHQMARSAARTEVQDPPARPTPDQGGGS